MNGAEAAVRTMEQARVEVCFANPGTSEMYLVDALDKSTTIRSVLVLFEGVATAAADGYGRMARKPAATLLHLGPGFANGLANLHNARRARTPILNIVGDHAVAHLQYDTPLTSNIDAYAAATEGWWRRSREAASLSADIADALTASCAGPGRTATVIVPADHMWTDDVRPADPSKPDGLGEVPDSLIEDVAEKCRRGGVALLLGGNNGLEEALAAAGRIRDACGAHLFVDTFMPRLERGAGRVEVARLPYFADWIADTLKDVQHLILVGANPPASFFAYKDQPSLAAPKGCEILTLATPREDGARALDALARALDAPGEPQRRAAGGLPELPAGELTAESVAASLAHLMPENAIVSDEATTAGLPLFDATAGAAPHSWLCLTGGAIGQGMPAAIGAAIACPDRKVINLQADGSAMYTLQALWTEARENLDITTVIYANHAYEILKFEMIKTGLVETAGATAQKLVSLAEPRIDWVKAAEGMGVAAERATTAEDFHAALERALAHKGPRLIEANIKPLF